MDAEFSFTSQFGEVYPLTMVFNSDQKKIWMLILIDDSDLFLSSYDTFNKLPDQNGMTASLMTQVSSPFYSFGMAYESFLGSNTLVILFVDNNSGMVYVLVGLEDFIDPS